MPPRTLFALALAAALLAACSSDERGASNGAGGTGMGSGAGMGLGGSMGPGGAGYGGGRVAPGTEEDLVQNVGDRIFFDTDRSDLTGNARNTLMRQAQWLQQRPTVNAVISGNCDERGTEEYNLGLGQRRAATDADFLAAQGVNAARLQTISYGKDRPVDPASTPDAWAKDRNAITQLR